MIAIITANFGKFDKQIEWEKQPCKVIKVDDFNFPLRLNAMTPRLQSKLVKMFMWDIYPNYDYYIWIDASFKMLIGATEWLLCKLHTSDIAVIKHPFNKTIKGEYEFLKEHIHTKYIDRRYRNELLDEQYDKIAKDKNYIDDCLFCGGIFIYKNTEAIRNMFKEWWFYTTRFHLDDQLSFPYVLKKSGCDYRIIDDDIYHLPFIPYMRH
jgi:hypothetical protein